jgi:hypothetical protein
MSWAINPASVIANTFANVFPDVAHALLRAEPTLVSALVRVAFIEFLVPKAMENTRACSVEDSSRRLCPWTAAQK